jgi:hypothetical protein
MDAERLIHFLGEYLNAVNILGAVDPAALLLCGMDPDKWCAGDGLGAPWVAERGAAAGVAGRMADPGDAIHDLEELRAELEHIATGSQGQFAEDYGPIMPRLKTPPSASCSSDGEATRVPTCNVSKSGTHGRKRLKIRKREPVGMAAADFDEGKARARL